MVAGRGAKRSEVKANVVRLTLRVVVLVAIDQMAVGVVPLGRSGRGAETPGLPMRGSPSLIRSLHVILGKVCRRCFQACFCALGRGSSDCVNVLRSCRSTKTAEICEKSSAMERVKCRGSSSDSTKGREERVRLK